MATVKKIKAVAATGGLGSGFLEETLQRTLKDGADFVGCDGGSTDGGPYYLGSGKVKSSRAAVKRDTRAILREALKCDVPVVIGTAGYAGGRPHLQWMLDIIREIARESNWHFKLAAIDCEIDKETLLDAYRAGELVALRPAPYFDETTIQNAERFVAMMGTEPFQRALKAGAQVVVAGRSSDVSIYAALPVMRGIPKGVAFHAGKILECGAACVTQRFYPDCMAAILDEEGFTVDPPNSAMRCSPESVASHTLYENPNPHQLLEPGGMLETSTARYEAVSDRAVRVTGSCFVPSETYTVRLEGATRVGYRSVAFAGVDDPLVLRQLKGYLSGLRKVLDRKIRDSLELQPDQYTLNWHVYGRNGNGSDVGSEADEGITDHRVGIMIDAVAATQSLASAVVTVAWHTGLHHPIPEYEGLVSNFAFPMSPPGIDAGPVYRFCVNHVWKLSDPCAPFRMTMEEV
jgi:hypothetical protein